MLEINHLGGSSNRLGQEPSKNQRVQIPAVGFAIVCKDAPNLDTEPTSHGVRKALHDSQLLKRNSDDCNLTDDIRISKSV